MLIQLQAVHYVYSAGTPLARPALRGIDLDIRPGERLGLLGPTGSGKSTLVQVVAGLLAPSAGRVLLDGVPAHGRSAEARARRHRVGLAFQYPEQQLFEPTVFREVAFGPRNLGLRATELEARVQWALDMVGLNGSEIGGRVPFALSGGEMRRVALAGILALCPEVLILDEPAAGLDPQGRRELLERVLAWQAETGATLVVISHHMDEVARLAERVVLLAEGRLAGDGPAPDIMGDAPRLHAAGLEAPPAVALLQALRQAGWSVRTDRLEPQDVAEEIARAWKTRATGETGR